MPAFTAFLAEGSTGTFFDYDLVLANPSLASVDAEITYFTSAGATVTQSLALPAQSRRTIQVDEVPGLEATAMSDQRAHHDGADRRRTHDAMGPGGGPAVRRARRQGDGRRGA